MAELGLELGSPTDFLGSTPGPGDAGSPSPCSAVCLPLWLPVGRWRALPLLPCLARSRACPEHRAAIVRLARPRPTAGTVPGSVCLLPRYPPNLFALLRRHVPREAGRVRRGGGKPAGKSAQPHAPPGPRPAPPPAQREHRRGIQQHTPAGAPGYPEPAPAQAAPAGAGDEANKSLGAGGDSGRLRAVARPLRRPPAPGVPCGLGAPLPGPLGGLAQGAPVG